MSTQAVKQEPHPESGVIFWARVAANTADSLERLLYLAEVFKADTEEKQPYTIDPAFSEVRKAWARRYVALGGDIKSSDVKDPTAFLDTLLGKNANGIELGKIFPVDYRSGAETKIAEPKKKPAKKRGSGGKYDGTLIGDE
jgi:hypothetical protein